MSDCVTGGAKSANFDDSWPMRLEERDMQSRPVSVVIINHNGGDDLARCIDSIKSQGREVEILVVDNDSRDGSAQRAKVAHPGIRLLVDGVNDGFAGGANRGALQAKGDALLFLNPDVILGPGCLTALLDAVWETGAPTLCAPVICDQDGGRVEYGFSVDYVGDLIALKSPGLPLFLSGCALMTTRTAFITLGGFDAAFFMFCEDLDLCWRALLHGFDVRVVPDAQHHR